MASGGLPLTVSVTVDPRTLDKTLIFSRPVSTAEASTCLFGNPSRSNLMKPIAVSVAGRTERYRLETHDVAIVMQLRADIRDAIIRGGQIRSTGKPFDFPAWVPAKVRQDILSGKLQGKLSRNRGEGEWGDIVVWQGNASVQLYQEFPENTSYYSGITSDSRQAHLLHQAYTQFNKDMSNFVETKGLSPEDARSEIRRINDEVFKLILEGAAAILSAGLGISQVNNAIRANAREVADAARRSPRILASGRIRPFNGKVNVGGGAETPQMTNLNPCKPGSGGPTSGIPNHVRGLMEEMDQIFEPESVDFMMSSKLRYVDVQWERATRAAAKVMRPGSRVEMNVWCQGTEGQQLKAQFERAGFKDVQVIGDGVGTMLSATK